MDFIIDILKASCWTKEFMC